MRAKKVLAIVAAFLLLNFGSEVFGQWQLKNLRANNSGFEKRYWHYQSLKRGLECWIYVRKDGSGFFIRVVNSKWRGGKAILVQRLEINSANSTISLYWHETSKNSLKVTELKNEEAEDIFEKHFLKMAPLKIRKKLLEVYAKRKAAL